MELANPKVIKIKDYLNREKAEARNDALPVNIDMATTIDYLYKFMRNKTKTTAMRIHVYPERR